MLQTEAYHRIVSAVFFLQCLTRGGRLHRVLFLALSLAGRNTRRLWPATWTGLASFGGRATGTDVAGAAHYRTHSDHGRETNHEFAVSACQHVSNVSKEKQGNTTGLNLSRRRGRERLLIFKETILFADIADNTHLRMVTHSF